MSGTAFEDEPSVDDWVACLRSFLTGFKERFANGGDELWRNAGSNNFIDKLVSGLISLRVNRFDVSNDSGVLPSSSGLFLVEIVECLSLKNGFSIVDSRLSSFTVNSILSFDSFNVNLEVKLPHAADNHLFRFSVHSYTKSGVFSFELRQGLLELGSIVLFAGVYCETHDRVRNEHSLASDRETVVSLR